MSCCFCSSSLFLCVTSWWLFSPSNFTAVNKKHTDCFSTIMTWQWDSSQTFCGCQATPVTPYTIYGHLLFCFFFKCTFPLLLLPLSLFLLTLTSLHLYQVFFYFYFYVYFSQSHTVLSVCDCVSSTLSLGPSAFICLCFYCFLLLNSLLAKGAACSALRLRRK